MIRYLGIDYGLKRIGLAIADDRAKLASPVQVITTRGDLAGDIRAVIETAAEYDADEFVVGLPLNMDGTEGEQARLTRRFAERLREAAGRPAHLFDERLSSRTADDLLGPAGLTRKKHKARQDAVAAAVLLQGFIDQREAE